MTAYVSGKAGYMTGLPEIAPGWPGTFVTATLNDLGRLLPQTLYALTETVPLDVVGIMVIEFVDEVPVQPAGTVQV